MGINLRTDEATDEIIDALAARWRTSKQNAIVRALRDTYERETGAAQIEALAAEVTSRYGEALDRLGKA